MRKQTNWQKEKQKKKASIIEIPYKDLEKRFKTKMLDRTEREIMKKE